MGHMPTLRKAAVPSHSDDEDRTLVVQVQEMQEGHADRHSGLDRCE